MCPARMARIESAVRVVIAFNEAFNKHDVPSMMQLVTGDCVFEDASPPPDGATYNGRDAISQYWQDFFRRFPQAHISVEEIFGYAVQCIIRWRYDWVDTAGTRCHVRGADIYRVQDGLISQKLSYVKG